MISEDERQLELRLEKRFQKRLKKFVGRPLTPELQTRMMTAMLEEIGYEQQERKGRMDIRLKRQIGDALMGPPRHGQDEASMMKDMGPGNMETAVNAIHLLSSELKQKNEATSRLIKESEGLRNHLYQRQTNLEHVALILAAVVTPEGQEMVRERAKLKPNNHKKMAAANHQLLADLREYLIEQKS